jgi:hypothetical protein
MKKFVIASIIGLTALGAQAHGYEHHGYRGGYGWGWVAPAVIGGAVVYATTRPPVVIQQPPVYVQPQPQVIVQQENCSPWTEIRNPDGSTTVTGTCR